ncbi:MAG: serine/threonine protein kinase [Chloroflexi bacterium]|nr:serine/threonine protein kinase [Chloroflexota bacterium]
MGTVYRAADSQTGNEVALKIISRDLALDPELIERFKREAEALRQLQHPNIVGFGDAFQHGEQYVIAMEYVPGGSLHDLIKQGPLPIDRARQIALDLCDALIRAHRLNIIHRDIKPENVLLAADGTPKLTDFGVARLVSEGNRLTGTGTQVGTPFYMSPEAWEGKPLDAQADIWSLGIVLYEMLSGEVPFGGETLVVVMNKVLTTPLPELKTKRADVPEGLTKIVAGMLARDKAVRYQTMREVAADIERGQTARPLSGTKPAEAKSQTKPTQWLPMGVGLGAIAVLVALAMWLSGQFQQAQTNMQQLAETAQAVATAANAHQISVRLQHNYRSPPKHGLQ